jgi:hypothetical protein
MAAEREGPPEKERPQRVTKPPRPDQKSATTTDGLHDNRSGRQGAYDRLQGNGRRHAWKRRLPPIEPCGCIRDPDYDRHRCGDEISDHMAEAAVAAIERLEQLDTPGLLDDRTCRAMWRRDYRDLSVRCYRYATGAA